MKIKNKVTVKAIKGITTLDPNLMDYGVLYYFTENEFETLEEAISEYEEMEVEQFAQQVQKVMKVVQPKLDALNNAASSS